MSRRSAIRATRHLYKLFPEHDVGECMYCGAPQECLDHFIPVQKYHVALALGFVKAEAELPLIPSCMKCNCTAKDKVFPSIAAKTRYIREQYEARNWNEIEFADWSEEELAEVKGVIRAGVLAAMEKKRWWRERLARMREREKSR